MIATTPDGRALAPHVEEPAADFVSEPIENRADAQPSESRNVPSQFQLGELRIILARAKDRQATARSKFSIARDRFLRAIGAQGPTPDELFRQHARDSNEYLRAIKEGRVSRPVYSRIGASVVDHMGAAMRGSGQRAGGGRAYTRGAYPSSMRGRKLPSES